MNKILHVLLINTICLLSVFEGYGQQTVGTLQAPREIIIETPGLLFSLPRFKINPGETVKVTLKNTDEMSHNWVLVKPGQREKVIAQALAMLTTNPNEQNFIPSSPDILQSIPLLKPGEEKSVIFTAPVSSRDAIYPYFCSYPGHGTIMFGAMYVTPFDMPPIELDVNVPASRREAAMDHTMMHKAVKPVTIYRTYMPNSGPAGIAVGMPGGISYNWDAGICQLRYAWSGGFIDLNKNWKGNGRDLAVIEGNVFYTETAKDPIRIGTKTHIAKKQFKGYTLTNNYPTFKYTLDDVQVTEKIMPTAGKEGIQRTFTFTNLKKPLWFAKAATDKKPGGTGKWTGDYAAVTPVAGKASLTLTFNK